MGLQRSRLGVTSQRFALRQEITPRRKLLAITQRRPPNREGRPKLQNITRRGDFAARLAAPLGENGGRPCRLLRVHFETVIYDGGIASKTIEPR